MSVSIQTLQAVCREAGMDPNLVTGFTVTPIGVQFDVLTVDAEGKFTWLDGPALRTHQVMVAVNGQ